jgi:hypothetical protein
MSENRGSDTGGLVSREVAVSCVAEDCTFELQIGVFEGTTTVESLLPSLRDRDDCPACGDRLEERTPEFAGAAPGRPAEW